MNISKLLIISVIFALLFIIGCKKEREEEIVNSNSKNNNTLTEQEKANGWQLLFDGKTMNGWHEFNSDGIREGGWIVENGTIVGLGRGSDLRGDIVTDKEFTNFDLRLEWKISRGGNSGIFYQGIEGKEYEAIYFTAPEYQLLDDVGYGGEVEEWQMAGANYGMHPADKSKKKLKMRGEWNSSRIVVKDSLVQYYLNGEKIVEFKQWTEDWKQRKANGKWKDFPDYGESKTGKIGLQDHGKKIWFRNIKIKTFN